ncbi:sperm-associated antigen 11B isoform X3 [Saimiri boliviensis]|uniref:Beta-defensin-like domain-containing protein n=1 Tax=Saimiri boliviensis boliviensis TaxID=39432 RepID=A0A2K6U4S1_SAIBB|nr:sperm-associated antigen 11B isoform X6 [Saimiri boliviensis boliviensis]
MKVLFLFAVLFYLVQTDSGDVPPGIRNTICLMQQGTCRLFFCHSGEKKRDICSDPWNRCCVSNTEEEEKEKPGKDGRSGI